jgi:environmental stress-induced protein Ves
VCVTAIPGIDEPTTFSSWNGTDRTVAVSEIMQCLLQWNYLNTTHTWTLVNAVRFPAVSTTRFEANHTPHSKLPRAQRCAVP